MRRILLLFVLSDGTYCMYILLRLAHGSGKKARTACVFVRARGENDEETFSIDYWHLQSFFIEDFFT